MHVVDNSYDDDAAAAMTTPQPPQTAAPAAFGYVQYADSERLLSGDDAANYGVINVAADGGSGGSDAAAAAPRGVPACHATIASAGVAASETRVSKNAGQDDVTDDIYSSMDHTDFRTADAATPDANYGPIRTTAVSINSLTKLNTAAAASKVASAARSTDAAAGTATGDVGEKRPMLPLDKSKPYQNW